jgi:predicted DNA-binding antitoxin AbrB/MazE fold protein
MTIRAVYQNGVLRPLQPLEITEGTEVEVTVTSRKSPPDPREGIERLLRIAAMPSEGEGQFSGQDHDKVLYGEAPNK